MQMMQAIECYRLNLFSCKDWSMTFSVFSFSIRTFLAAGIVLAWCGAARGEDRQGTVEWSDGHKLAGAISLSAGRNLRIYSTNEALTVPLAEVKEIHFKPEKEEMWEGFYFPNAGQTTQVKTGEVYPIRYLQTQLTLADGKIIEGHLFTTTFYVETNDGLEKVVLMAKQTGANGQKLTDLAYPTAIRFDAESSSAGFSQVDLTQAGLADMHPPVIVARPDLALLSVEQTAGKSIWTVPWKDSDRLLFAVEAGDGIHVAWPQDAASGPDTDPDMQRAVKVGLVVMEDFYDNRELLGSFAGDDATNIYSLVMMKRTGDSESINGDQMPWSLIILRWKYDPDLKRVTLLNRAPLAIGRTQNSSSPPTVFKQPELLKDISVKK